MVSKRRTVIAAVWNDRPVTYTAGRSYFSNFFPRRSRDIILYFFVSRQAYRLYVDVFRNHQYVRVVTSPFLNERFAVQLIRRISRKLLGMPLAALVYSLFFRISVLTHNQSDFRYRLPIGPRMISWIPDFQLLHYPQFFSKKAKISFVSYVRRIWRVSDAVLVSSQDARKDLESICPLAGSKARVIPFSVVAYHSDQPRSRAPQAVGDEKLFFLPNQFWRHKNHDTVVRAWSVFERQYLATSAVNARLVLTGSTIDHRTGDDSYFREVSRLIERLSLRHVELLGTVAYAKVLELHQRCSVLINPSLFEGWSTTIEEGMAHGKPVIVADIPVNREQLCDYTDAMFVDPRDEAGFTAAFVKILNLRNNATRRQPTQISLLRQNRYFERWYNLSAGMARGTTTRLND